MLKLVYLITVQCTVYGVQCTVYGVYFKSMEAFLAYMNILSLKTHDPIHYSRIQIRQNISDSDYAILVYY